MTHTRLVCLVCFFTLFAATLACGGSPGVHADANLDPDAAEFADAYPIGGTQFVWQAPGGFSGLGPALEILDDGRVHLWDSHAGFDPAAPPADFDRTINVTPATHSDLFARWALTDTSNLPHDNGSAECASTLYVKYSCRDCAPTRIDYSIAPNVEPEMEQVWVWFDGALANEPAANNPRNFCRL